MGPQRPLRTMHCRIKGPQPFPLRCLKFHYGKNLQLHNMSRPQYHCPQCWVPVTLQASQEKQWHWKPILRASLKFNYHELQKSGSSVSFPGQHHSPKASGIAWEGCEGLSGQRSALRRDSRTRADPRMRGTRETHNPPGNKLVSWLQSWRKIPRIFMQGKSLRREKRAVTKNTSHICMYVCMARCTCIRSGEVSKKTT